MYGSTKQLFILLYIPCLCVALCSKVKPYSSQPRKTVYHVNTPETVSPLKRFEENAPTLFTIFQILSELILVLLWTVDSTLNVLLWILNEAVTSCTEFALHIFGAFFHVVKLLEAFGFGIKLLLEVNHTVVSYFFNTAASLRENFHYAVTLVKITLANETEHVYETGSMALEGIHSLFLITCNYTWTAFSVALEKAHFFVSLAVDNFKGCFGFFVLDVSSMATTLLAAMKFFLESIIITAGVIGDGIVFLFKYLADAVFGLGTRSLINMQVVCKTALRTIAMAMHYLIFLVAWPIHLVATIISRTVYLLCSWWVTVVNLASYLDKLAREVIQSSVCGVAQFTLMVLSKTLMFTNIYVPGGTAGLCIIVFVVTGLFLKRESVMTHFRSALIILRRVVGHEQDGIAADAWEIEDEEFPVGQITEEEEEYLEPGISAEGEVSKGQQELKYELEREKDKRLCVICQDKIKNVLLLPCRHVCLCHQCLQDIRHGHIQLANCPLCRQVVQSTMKVFV